jgi:tetratricopeptide (TPR) repeat protein
LLAIEVDHLPSAIQAITDQKFVRGKALLAEKEWALSIEDFRRVIDTHPEIYQAHANMGIAYYNMKLGDKALDAFNQSIDINPNYGLGYFGKAMALKKLGETEASGIALKKACDLGHQPSCIIISYTQKLDH